MRKHGRLTALALCAALSFTAIPVSAEAEQETEIAADSETENETENATDSEPDAAQDPAVGSDAPAADDIVMLYTGIIPDPVPEGDPLLNFLNEKRDLNGAVLLEQDDALSEHAAERVAALEQNSAGADVSGVDGADACEIVVRGNADINTMLSSLLMSKRQSLTIYYSGFTKFGYAHNEDETIWVLQFTS